MTTVHFVSDGCIVGQPQYLTRCGKEDVRNTMAREKAGFEYIPLMSKTDDWGLVTCKLCLKTVTAKEEVQRHQAIAKH